VLATFLDDVASGVHSSARKRLFRRRREAARIVVVRRENPLSEQRSDYLFKSDWDVTFAEFFPRWLARLALHGLVMPNRGGKSMMGAERGT